MNPQALTVNEQSLQDPLFIDWLLQNPHLLNPNQLPSGETNANGRSRNALLDSSSPLTTMFPLPPSQQFDNKSNNISENTALLLNNHLMSLDPSSGQMLLQKHRKFDGTQNRNMSKTGLNNSSHLKAIEESEQPLDLSSSNNSNVEVKNRRKVSDQYLQKGFIPMQHKQLTTQNHPPPISPFLRETNTMLPTTNSHLMGGGYTQSAAFPALTGFPVGLSPPSSWSIPAHTPLLSCSAFSPRSSNSSTAENDTLPAAPVIWVPFASFPLAIGGNPGTIPARIYGFSDAGINRETSAQMLKMVPINPSLFPGRNGQPSSAGGKWPSEKQVPPQMSPNFCSPSTSNSTPVPVFDSQRKPSEASSASSSSTSSSSAFIPPSSSILVRRRLRAMLKNRSS